MFLIPGNNWNIRISIAEFVMLLHARGKSNVSIFRFIFDFADEDPVDVLGCLWKGAFYNDATDSAVGAIVDDIKQLLQKGIGLGVIFGALRKICPEVNIIALTLRMSGIVRPDIARIMKNGDVNWGEIASALRHCGAGYDEVARILECLGANLMEIARIINKNCGALYPDTEHAIGRLRDNHLSGICEIANALVACGMPDEEIKSVLERRGACTKYIKIAIAELDKPDGAKPNAKTKKHKPKKPIKAVRRKRK
jgi:hypothetical protein